MPQPENQLLIGVAAWTIPQASPQRHLALLRKIHSYYEVYRVAHVTGLIRRASVSIQSHACNDQLHCSCEEYVAPSYTLSLSSRQIYAREVVLGGPDSMRGSASYEWIVCIFSTDTIGRLVSFLRHLPCGVTRFINAPNPTLDNSPRFAPLKISLHLPSTTSFTLAILLIYGPKWFHWTYSASLEILSPLSTSPTKSWIRLIESRTPSPEQHTKTRALG